METEQCWWLFDDYATKERPTLAERCPGDIYEGRRKSGMRMEECNEIFSNLYG